VAAPPVAHPAGTAPVPPRAIVVNEGAATPVGRAPAAHVVVSGDTLWGIATKYKVSADELMKANGISDAKKLKLGMSLKLPAAR
jgi:LysM repeat protein